MKISNDHVLTTHTGSLPRPEQLVDLVYTKQEGKKVDSRTFESIVGKTANVWPEPDLIWLIAAPKPSAPINSRFLPEVWSPLTAPETPSKPAAS
jgi:hypothetical protein